MTFLPLNLPDQDETISQCPSRPSPSGRAAARALTGIVRYALHLVGQGMSAHTPYGLVRRRFLVSFLRAMPATSSDCTWRTVTTPLLLLPAITMLTLSVKSPPGR